VIIDSFPFNDELDMLELRLGQLDSVVDYFVLVETSRTFSGMAKPLYFKDNKDRFSKWNHKIVHASPELGCAGSWEFEKIQREVLVNMIRGLNPGLHDTLTFSDCDEIPNPEAIKSYTYNMGLRNLKQYTYYYNFNHLFDYGNRAWSRARIGVVEHMYDHGAMGFRGGWPPGRDMDASYPSMEEGGWHGSYFNPDLAKVRRKVVSISHDDLWPFIAGRSDKQLAEDIHNGKDLYHRAGIGDAVWVDTKTAEDHRLPPYFLQNKERFKMFTDEYFMEVNSSLVQQPDTGKKTDIQITKVAPTYSMPKRRSYRETR
jgi:beta-1,4-mannosyl-glycoprotein beta-1,4-N-acetylglucosaminyltransferase